MYSGALLEKLAEGSEPSAKLLSSTLLCLHPQRQCGDGQGREEWVYAQRSVVQVVSCGLRTLSKKFEQCLALLTPAAPNGAFHY